MNQTDPIMTVKIEPQKVDFQTKLKNFFARLGSEKNVIGASIGTLALIAFVAAGVVLIRNVQKTKTNASSAILSLSTNNTAPKVGNNITVAVAIDTQGLAVTGSALEIKYDPNFLTPSSWQAGSYLPVIFVPAANTNGTLTVTLGSDPSAPKTGTGVLAQAVFTAKASGTTNITFGTGTLVTAVGQTVNVAGTMTPVQINVSDIGTPTSTPQVTAAPVTTEVTPQGYLDGITPSGSASGWAIDRNTNSPIKVLFYLDGTTNYLGTVNTGEQRIDVYNATGGFGLNSGYSYQIPSQYLTDGKLHKLYVFAQDVLPGGSTGGNTQLLNSGMNVPMLTSTVTPTPNPTQTVTPAPVSCIPAGQHCTIGAGAPCCAGSFCGGTQYSGVICKVPKE